MLKGNQCDVKYAARGWVGILVPDSWQNQIQTRFSAMVTGFAMGLALTALG